MARIAGVYVFFYATLDVIVGLCYKAYLGEPAESNLLEPTRTIEVYVAGISAMLIAVFISRRFTRKTGLLQNVLDESRMFRSAIGCIVFGIIGPLLIALLGDSGDILQSGFGQLNKLVPMGILLGVYYEIRRSHGRRSLSFPILLTGVYIFFCGGIVSFSKQGMITPLICWVLPVCVLRYRLSIAQVVGCILCVFIFFHYLSPYSQYGRRFMTKDQTFTERAKIGFNLLSHPNDLHDKYVENAPETFYYNTNQGFWDRLQFISVDDGLINDTDQGRVYGLSPIKMGFLNVIPRVFWHDKVTYNYGYIYILEYGGNIPNEEDYTSGPGISFSPTGEAYHLAKWRGVLIVAPLLWLLTFVVMDAVFGNLTASPWGFLVIVTIAHIAPEGMLTGLIYLFTFGTTIFVFCALFAAWVAPIFAIAVLGPERHFAAQLTSFAPANGPGPGQDRPRLWSAGPPGAHES